MSVTHPTHTCLTSTPCLQASGYCDLLISFKWISKLLITHCIPKEACVQSHDGRPYCSRYFTEQKAVCSKYCGEGWENVSKITTHACFILWFIMCESIRWTFTAPSSDSIFCSHLNAWQKIHNTITSLRCIDYCCQVFFYSAPRVDI